MPQPVIDRIPACVRLLTEEIFGPVAAIAGFDTEAEGDRRGEPDRIWPGVLLLYPRPEPGRSRDCQTAVRGWWGSIAASSPMRQRRSAAPSIPASGAKAASTRHRRLPRDQVRRDLTAAAAVRRAAPVNDHPLTRQPTDHLLPARNGVASTRFPLGASKRIHEAALTIQTSCLPAARPTAHAYPTWPIAVQQPRPSSSDPESRAAPTIRTCRRWSGFTWSVLRSS